MLALFGRISFLDNFFFYFGRDLTGRKGARQGRWSRFEAKFKDGKIWSLHLGSLPDSSIAGRMHRVSTQIYRRRVPSAATAVRIPEEWALYYQAAPSLLCPQDNTEKCCRRKKPVFAVLPSRLSETPLPFSINPSLPLLRTSCTLVIPSF